ncbi:MAG: hypothetical protein IT462_14040 [Planctomycetes bacterium]|nr:hypothetical protein [Planctomycetota bacterium]
MKTLALLGLLAAFCAGLPGQERKIPPSLQITVVTGFHDVVAIGRPAPVTVLLHNHTDQAISATVRLSTGMDILGESRLVQRVNVSPGVGKQLSFLVAGSQSLSGGCRVETDRDVIFTDAIGAKIEKNPARSVGLALGEYGDIVGVETVIAVMGGRARQWVSTLRGRLVEVSMLPNQQVQLCELEERFAPDHQMALAGVSTLVWTEPNPDNLPDPACLEVIKRWVACGGRLVLMSAHAPRALSHPGLADILPARVTGSTDVPYPHVPITFGGLFLNRSTEGVAAHTPFIVDRYIRANECIIDARGPWLATEPLAGAFVRKARDGTNWDELPSLAVERRFGNGYVRMACFDPLVYDRAEQLPMLHAFSVATGLTIAAPNAVRTHDVPEVAERRFVEVLQNNNLRPLSIGPFVLIAILFLLVVGPLDYLLLSRGKLLKYSAVSLILYTVIFCAGSVLATFYLFSPAPQTNRITVADFAELPDGTEHASALTLQGCFRPLGGSYRVDVADHEVFSMPMGDSGYSGGMTSLYDGAGRAPLEVQQPFNSFRAVMTRAAGKPAGSVVCRLGREGASWYFEVNNGLSHELFAGCLRTPLGCMSVPDVAPGQKVRVVIVPAKLASWDAVSMSVSAGFDQARVKMDSGRWDFPPMLVDAVMVPDVGGARLRPGYDPVRIALDKDSALYTAFTLAQPFTDSLAGDNTGFNITFARRLMPLPEDFPRK